MKMKLLLAAAVFGLTGCMTMEKVSTYPDYSLEDDPIFSAITSGKKHRVILLDLKEFYDTGDVKGLGSQAVGELRNIIHGVTEIIDINQTIRKEMVEQFELIEAGGASSYSPPAVATFAISGELNAVSWLPNYSKGYESKNIITGEKTWIPESCTYKANVKGSLIFYGLNPVEKKHSILLDGHTSRKEENAKCKNLSSSQIRDLYIGALQDAYTDTAVDIKQKLAASGYVVKAKKHPAKPKIFYRISLKPVDGAKAGVMVDFQKAQTVEGKVEKFAFATGKVACTDREDVSYVMVDDPMAIESIMKSTPVKLNFHAGGFKEKMEMLFKPFGPCKHR